MWPSIRLRIIKPGLPGLMMSCSHTAQGTAFGSFSLFNVFTLWLIIGGAYPGWEFLAVACRNYTGFVTIIGGVVGYGQLVIARLLSTVDNSLGWGSHIYLQRGFAASNNSSAIVCFHKRLSPISTLNAGVGYFLWSHWSPKHRGVERQLTNHLPFTI